VASRELVVIGMRSGSVIRYRSMPRLGSETPVQPAEAQDLHGDQVARLEADDADGPAQNVAALTAQPERATGDHFGDERDVGVPAVVTGNVLHGPERRGGREQQVPIPSLVPVRWLNPARQAVSPWFRGL
jgi:hypothetical protein